MSDRRRRDVVTQFPGNLLLQQEVEKFLETTSAPRKPSDSLRSLVQPGSSSTYSTDSVAYREASHPPPTAAVVKTINVQHEKHDLGGLGSDLPLKQSSPWDSYSKDYRRELGSSVVIVYKKPTTRQLFAMKNVTGPEINHKIQILRQVRHKNFVLAYEVFLYNNMISIIFEYMAVSLVNINSSARGRPNELQVATIVHQVLNGIAFLESKGMMHGDITCGTVLISRDGDVKIANPEGCIDISSSSGQKVKDTKALGQVMLQVMERGSIPGKHPSLKEPSRWSAEAGKFLELTHSASIQQLLSHAFLKESPRNEELVRLVDLAGFTSHISLCLETS